MGGRQDRIPGVHLPPSQWPAGPHFLIFHGCPEFTISEGRPPPRGDDIHLRLRRCSLGAPLFTAWFFTAGHQPGWGGPFPPGLLNPHPRPSAKGDDGRATVLHRQRPDFSPRVSTGGQRSGDRRASTPGSRSRAHGMGRNLRPDSGPRGAPERPRPGPRLHDPPGAGRDWAPEDFKSGKGATVNPFFLRDPPPRIPTNPF